jgi:hypothetical protein
MIARPDAIAENDGFQQSRGEAIRPIAPRGDHRQPYPAKSPQDFVLTNSPQYASVEIGGKDRGNRLEIDKEQTKWNRLDAVLATT